MEEADSRGAYLVVIAMTMLAVFSVVPRSTAGLLTTLSTVCVVAAALLGLRRGLRPMTQGVGGITLMVVLALLVATTSIVIRAVAGPVYGGVFGGLGVIWIWMVNHWRFSAPPRTAISVAVGFSLVALLVASIAAVVASDDPVIDVIAVNEAGAAALADFENPYSTVVVEDRNRYASEGDEFEGYVYPPMTLILVSLSEWLTGDVRWISALAMAAFMLLILSPKEWRSGNGLFVVSVVAGVAATMPVLAHVLRQGWTEPIALPLLAGAVLLWRKKPAASAVLLGFALATKQYYILVAPLLILWKDEYRTRRLAIAGGVVLATIVPFLLLDPLAMWDAMVVSLLSLDARPDSLNVISLGYYPPSWMAPLAAAIVAVVLGRRGGDGASFAIAVAATLGVSFVFGSQAYVNYWFLLYYLVVIALVAASLPPVHTDKEYATVGDSR